MATVTKTKPKVEEHKVSVYDMQAKKIDTFDLDKRVFGGKVNVAVLHQATLLYAANRRSGTASTKTRAEVRGGGKKPWRQKGTGRARFGSIRNPIWRGGGIAFGPRPRDFSYTMPRKVRLAAIGAALHAKYDDKAFFVVDGLKFDEPKAKKMRALFERFKIEPHALVVTDKLDETLRRVSRNFKNVTVRLPEHVCSDDVVRHRSVMVTKTALQKLVRRILE